jgi:hypothetical protein
LGVGSVEALGTWLLSQTITALNTTAKRIGAMRAASTTPTINNGSGPSDAAIRSTIANETIMFIQFLLRLPG